MIVRTSPWPAGRLLLVEPPAARPARRCSGQGRCREEGRPVALAFVGELALGRAVARDAARELVASRAIGRLQPVVPAEDGLVVPRNALAPRVQAICAETVEQVSRRFSAKAPRNFGFCAVQDVVLQAAVPDSNRRL